MILIFLALFLVNCLAESSLDIMLKRGETDEFSKPGVQCKDCYLSVAKCPDAKNSTLDKTDVCRCLISPSTYVFAGNDSGCVADQDLIDPNASKFNLQFCYEWIK